MLKKIGFNNMKLILIIILFFFSQLESKTIHVGEAHQHKLLKDGLAVSASGDTVNLYAGTYFETGLIIDKLITLVGIADPVVDARDSGQTITVTADSVKISGIVFKNSGRSFLDDNAAVKFENVQGGTIENCVFINNFFAIYLAESNDCLIKNNVIKGDAISEARSGNGIHLWYCKSINIINNNVKNHRDGIYLEFVESSFITENRSKNNLRYGLHFMFSDKNVFTENHFIENGSGVAVMYSRHVDMIGNTFLDNWGSASFGLLAKDIYDSNIQNNEFNGNTIGLYTEGSNRLDVKNNRFINNGWAVKVMANSMDNQFTSNSFISNSFDISTNGRQNFNSFAGNYWSRYTGYDMDKDGIGDVPYRPVKLFSFIVENNEPAIMLLNSAFINMINIAENILPVLTPETLLDHSPLMENIHD